MSEAGAGSPGPANAQAPARWDGAAYDGVSDPQVRMGAAVVARLDLSGDERVLDAGCGSGRVTELLLERLPDGRVVALDASQSMLTEARRRLAPHLGDGNADGDPDPDRVTFVRADLGEPLPPGLGSFDAVLSTAVFHWVRDHDALFRHLAAVLRPGGQLVAQCGGAGNTATVLAALEQLGAASVWNFATPEQTALRLAAAGFADAEVWLQPEPVVLEPGEPLETYLATVVLPAHLAAMPAAERPAFVRAVAARLPGPELDYVRLNIVARRDRDRAASARSGKLPEPRPGRPGPA